MSNIYDQCEMQDCPGCGLTLRIVDSKIVVHDEAIKCLEDRQLDKLLIYDKKFDKFLGMFWGCALGDAIGAPYEFSYKRNLTFSNNLNPITGSVTDDTEMMLALANTIIEKQDYQIKHVIEAYNKWLWSEPFDAGYNTRKLFYAIPSKAIDNYHASYKELMSKPMSEWSQSNGCLMRCMPMIVFHPSQQMWLQDCAISNPHPNCLQSTDLYFVALHKYIKGETCTLNDLQKEGTSLLPSIQSIIEGVQNNENRDVSEQRGWVLHALHFVVKAIHKPYETFEAAMQDVIGNNLNSDTDTNACIVGALVGAQLGFTALMKSSSMSRNIAILRQKSRHRPSMYHSSSIDKIAQQLYKLYVKNNDQ